MAHGERPKRVRDYVWPHGHGVKEGGAGKVLCGAYIPFGDAVLPMRPDATECLLLFVGVELVLKGFGDEYTIVGSVFHDGVVVVSAESFVSLFAFDGFGGV